MTLSRHDDDRTLLYVTYVKTSVSWSLIVWNLVLIQTIFVPKIFTRDFQKLFVISKLFRTLLFVPKIFTRDLDFQKLFCFIKTWNSSKLNLILENQHSCCFRFLIDFLILVMVASQFRYITLHYSALQYITFHCITLQCVTLRYVTVPYITLHYVTLQGVAGVAWLTLTAGADKAESNLHCNTLR